MRSFSKPISIVVLAALVCTGCWPQPPSDDAGPTTFYDQFVPLVLGRKLRNAHERNLLLDLEAIYGRQVVMDMLMEQPEFVTYWQSNFLRGMEVQREGNRGQEATCFGTPMRLSPAGDNGELAGFIRDNPVTSNYPGTWSVGNPGAEAVPDDPFNFLDLLASALVLDDLSVIYKAYHAPLMIKDGGLDSAEEIGKAYNRAFLNRNLECSECHSLEKQTLMVPFQIDLEPAVFGCAECSGDGIDQSEIWSVFRQDITGDDAPGGISMLRPWGLHPDCGTLVTEFSDGSQPTVFAGLSGGYVGAPHLIDQFSDGVESIRTNGLLFSSGSYTDQALPPDQALVYMVTAKMVEDIWVDLLGSPLTNAHYFAKNGDQRDMHRHLTEQMVGYEWSLKALISKIMMTGYANRRTPAQSLQPQPSALPAIFDPYALPNNDSGELVFRYPPHALFSHLQHSLGWQAWKPFPGNNSYPNMELNRELEQYLSDSSAGARDWSFQSLLAWEDLVTACDKPGNGADWVSRLVNAVDSFDAEHPEDPLKVRDVVKTVKDRLVGDVRISNGPETDIDDFQNDQPYGVCCGPEPIDDWAAPGGGEEPEWPEISPLPPIDAETELEALEYMFGTGLHNPANTVDDLDLRVRRYCGTLLKSPQRVLAGMIERKPPSALEAPQLVVCNPGEPCTYRQICQDYKDDLDVMGRDVTCSTGSVWETPGITLRSGGDGAPRDPMRERNEKLVANFVATFDPIDTRAYAMLDPRTGEPLRSDDIDLLVNWARSLSSKELLEQVPTELLYGMQPSSDSFERLLSVARHSAGGCSSDTDRDGLCDDVDPCLYYPNQSPETDTDGDGVPNECQCGDTDRSGKLDSRDLDAVAECAAIDPKASRTGVCIGLIVQGDANATGEFEKEDAQLIQAVLLGKVPSYSLTCALRPEATPPPRR